MLHPSNSLYKTAREKVCFSHFDMRGRGVPLAVTGLLRAWLAVGSVAVLLLLAGRIDEMAFREIQSVQARMKMVPVAMLENQR